MKNSVFAIIIIFISLIVFEIAIYANIKNRFTDFEYKLKSVNIEIEELRKTQRLMSQDADLALRLAVESAGENDEQ